MDSLAVDEEEFHLTPKEAAEPATSNSFSPKIEGSSIDQLKSSEFATSNIDESKKRKIDDSVAHLPPEQLEGNHSQANKKQKTENFATNESLEFISNREKNTEVSSNPTSTNPKPHDPEKLVNDLTLPIEGDTTQDGKPETSSNSREILSQALRCFICHYPFDDLTVEEREKHVNNCLDVNNSSDKEFQEQSYVCDICGKDITKYDKVLRQQHMNICLDKFQLESIASVREVKELEQFEDMRSVSYQCPICARDISQSTLKSRIIHLKNCAKKTTAIQRKEGDSESSKKQKKSKSKSKSRTTNPQSVVTSKFFSDHNPPQDDLLKTLSKYKRTSKSPSTSISSSKKHKKNQNNKPKKNDIINHSKEGDEEDFMIALAMSKSLDSHKSRATDKQDIVKSLFPLNSTFNDDSPISPTPKFAESNLSKKYNLPMPRSPLHKKQVVSIYQSQSDTSSKNDKQNAKDELRQEKKQADIPKRTPINLGLILPDEGGFKVPFHVQEMDKPDKEDQEIETVNLDNERVENDRNGFNTEEKNEYQPRDTLRWSVNQVSSPIKVNALTGLTDQMNELQKFKQESKKILMEYQQNILDKRQRMKQKIKRIENSYYAKIGKLTVEKETKLASLMEKYNVNQRDVMYLEVPPAMNTDPEVNDGQMSTSEHEKSDEEDCEEDQNA